MGGSSAPKPVETPKASAAPKITSVTDVTQKVTAAKKKKLTLDDTVSAYSNDNMDKTTLG